MSRLMSYFIACVIIISLLHPLSAQAKLTRARDSAVVYATQIKELAQLIESVDSCSSPQKLNERLKRLGTVQIPDDATAQLVFLIAVVEKTAFFAKNELLKSLHIVDEHIIYWREQGNHVISYFFNKSPVKLFVGSSQYKEIGKNLQWLKKIQKQYFESLGKLNNQLTNFVSDASISEQLEWLGAMVEVMKTLPSIDSTCSTLPDLPGILCAVKDTLHGLSHFQKKLIVQIDEAQMSGYFTIKNSMLATATLAVAHYLYINPNTYDEIKKWTQEGVGHFYTNNVQGPFDRIHNALWGESADFDILSQRFNEAINSMESGPNSAPMAQANKRLFRQEYRDVITEYYRMRGRPMTDREERHAADLNIDFLQEIFLDARRDLGQQGLYFSSYPGAQWTSGIRRWWSGQEVAPEDTSTKSESIIIIMRIISLMGQIGHYAGMEVKDETVKFLKVMSTDLSTQVPRIINQLQLTASLLALVPTIAVGWVGWKLSKKLYLLLVGAPYNFRFTRFVLHDLHKLLIENSDIYMHEMDFESQGKLLFYIYQLKIDAYSHMRYDQSNRFIGDIEALESTQLSSNEKREIIQGMWNTYTVLKPGYKVS